MSVDQKDILPAELASISSRLGRRLSATEFRTKPGKAVDRHLRKQIGEGSAGKTPRNLTYEDKSEAERFINYQLQPFYKLTEALARMLASSARQADRRFKDLVSAWEDSRKSKDPYKAEELDRLFCRPGLEAAIFALWSHDELKLP